MCMLLGFELAASLLLGRYSTLVCSGYFGDRVSLFAQASLDCDLPISSFLLSLDDRYTPPCSSFIH
jgi:hypothetical protein